MLVKLQAFTFEGLILSIILSKVPGFLALVKVLGPTYEGVP